MTDHDNPQESLHEMAKRAGERAAKHRAVSAELADIASRCESIIEPPAEYVELTTTNYNSGKREVRLDAYYDLFADVPVDQVASDFWNSASVSEQGGQYRLRVKKLCRGDSE